MRNLLGIPCPGCGMTRAVIFLVKGNVIMSMRYNILVIPLLCIYVIWSAWYLVDSMKKKDTLNQYIAKHKIVIVVICVILFLISFIRNLNNPLLY